jgi:hypothetical protein
MGCDLCGGSGSSAPAPNVPAPADNIFMTTLAEIAKERQNRATAVFNPLEDQAVQSVQQWQTPAYANEQAGLAQADVSRKFGEAKTASDANLASLGVNPNSGRYSYVNRGLDAAQGLATAAAGTTSRQNTRQLAYDTLVGLSGRGDAKVGQAIGAATAGGQQYNYGVTNAIAQQRNQLDQQAQDNSGLAGLGSAFGTGLGVYAALGGFSSKKLKTQRRLATGALEATRKMPVQTYKYKRGLGMLPGQHVGPMAEDMQAATGIGDGKMIAHQDIAGLTLGAVQQLDKKVTKLEKRHG